MPEKTWLMLDDEMAVRWSEIAVLEIADYPAGSKYGLRVILKNGEVRSTGPAVESKEEAQAELLRMLEE